MPITDPKPLPAYRKALRPSDPNSVQEYLEQELRKLEVVLAAYAEALKQLQDA